MSKKTKNFIITLLLIMATAQGPLFYYLFDGFFKLLFLIPFTLIALFFTIYAFIKLIKDKSTTTHYHIIGLSFAIILGIGTVNGTLVEHFDFNLRKTERNKIVNEIRNGTLKSDHVSDSLFPISKDGDINIKENRNGIVSVEFYIDRGFVDHYSAFLYTNDPKEIHDLETHNTTFSGTFKKLDTNWYKVSY